jgi:hypothetical protein
MLSVFAFKELFQVHDPILINMITISQEEIYLYD